MDNLLAFFGLREDPFRLTPDPDFFFPSTVHQEALHSLEYIVRNREGFCMVTGEPGTGKTTLISVFREQWRDRAEIALVLTPRLLPDEFLLTIFEELKMQTAGRNKNELLKGLKELLIEKYLMSRYVIIIVDEAHNLPDQTMEELRLLSNLETEKEKLLQIILIGQPELELRLKQEQLRQLDQRITERIRLRPLTLQETAAYIQHRLKKAGKENVELARQALRDVQRFSRGIPRLINLVLSRTIMAAYIDNNTAIQKKHFTYALSYLAGRRAGKTPIPRIAFGMALATVCCIIIAVLGYRFIPLKNNVHMVQPAGAAAGSAVLSTQASSTIPPREQSAEGPPPVIFDKSPQQQTALGIVKFDAANVRSEPRRDAPRVGMLYQGTRVESRTTVKDQQGITWYKIFESQNNAGWISEEVLAIETREQQSAR